MECPSCHSDTPDTSKFCIRCGAALEGRCPSCGKPNLPDAKFCAECGQKLSAAKAGTITKPATAPTAPAPQAAGSAERRQLTIMLCDLVGSTALSARLDPEDMREIIGAYHRRCTEHITKAGGFVAKFMGDGVLAYFGYPKAHEDDAERAVGAGLALVEAVPKLRADHDATLQVRVGIATGVVVVGDLIGEGAAREQGVVGGTPNLAARLQALAEPGQVLISQSTRRLTGGLFEYHDLGRVALKGLDDPVQAWQVTGATSVQSRFEAQHETSLIPLIGREEELDLLLRRWRQAASGEGRVVLISGEPGVGKSRLTVALEERLQGEPHTRLRYFCSPHHQDSALYPTISQLERAAGFERHDTPQAKLDKLASLLGPSSSGDNDVQLLAELLSIPTDDRYSPLNLSPQRRKQKTLAALLRQLEMLSRQRPALMVLEDAHWIDPSSRELLDMTVERVARLAVLLLTTFRPEFQPPWTGQAHVSTLNLSRLGRRDGAALVERVVGNNALPNEITAEIVERADGVPLFVEELTKAVLEADAGDEHRRRMMSKVPLSALAVPSSLHASLMARLDRLGPVAKEVAQIGSTIGREFSYDLLAAVAQKSDGELLGALGLLSNAGLIFCRGTPPQASFLFKHALVRDAAYGSLLRGQRQLMHGRIASEIERCEPDVVTAQPERLAYHLQEAGLIEPAVQWWGKAGDLALRRSAFQEAVAHLEKALVLSGGLSDGPERRQLRARFQITLGNALMSARGYQSQETSAAFARARELAAGIEDAPERFSAYYGLWVGSLTRAELAPMREVAEAFLRDAERRPRSPEAGVAHRVSGVTFWVQGDFLGARAHLEQALAIYDPARDRELAFRFGQETGAAAKIFLALTLWPLGEVEQARSCAEEAVSRAAQSGHTPTIGYAHTFSCFFETLRGDAGRTRAHADALVGHSREHGLPHLLAWGTVFERWARWRAGDQGVGAAGIRESFALVNQIGYRLFQPLFAALAAEAEASEGQIEAALAILDNQLVETARSGQRWHDAELHRLRGELLLRCQSADVGGAKTAFTRAIEVARDQWARSFELRAGTDLARFWRDQGKRTEARDLLAPIYGWFTEGFDTPDLKEAKKLLDELS